MVRGNAAAPSTGANMFAILQGKAVEHKVRPRKQPPSKKEITTHPAAAPAVDSTAEKPKKIAKVMKLTDEIEKQAAQKTEDKKVEKKEEITHAKAEKVQKDLTDRHDRSGKGSRVRKEGKGVGGWEEPVPAREDIPLETPEEKAEEQTAPDAAEGAPAAADAPNKVKARERSDEDKKRLEEEAKQRELEEKQLTYEEYLEQKKKDELKAQFNIRKVDASGFSNLKQLKSNTGGLLKVTLKEKKEKAPVEKKPAEKKEKKEEKKPEKKEEKKEEKKISLAETGFRMENPAVRQERGGRGGGRGFGRGRGRGEYAAQSQPQAANVSNPPPMDNAKLFPALKTGAGEASPSKVENKQ